MIPLHRLACLAPALLPALALAAEEAGHAADHAHEKGGVIPTPLQGLVPGITALVVFAIVFAVLATRVWPKIAQGLRDREGKIRSEIEAAETAREQAKAALQQYERALADARAEAQRMLEQAKAQQQALAADLRSKAEAELTAMKDRARREIDAAKRAALAELSGFSVDLANRAASKILEREVSRGDHARLIDEALGELQSSARA